jgi:hypothetical protein
MIIVVKYFLPVPLKYTIAKKNKKSSCIGYWIA